MYKKMTGTVIESIVEAVFKSRLVQILPMKYFKFLSCKITLIIYRAKMAIQMNIIIGTVIKYGNILLDFSFMRQLL